MASLMLRGVKFCIFQSIACEWTRVPSPFAYGHEIWWHGMAQLLLEWGGILFYNLKSEVCWFKNRHENGPWASGVIAGVDVANVCCGWVKVEHHIRILYAYTCVLLVNFQLNMEILIFQLFLFKFEKFKIIFWHI